MPSDNNINPFILASGSPRRSLLLRTSGYDFEVIVSQVSEEHDGLAEPEETAIILAARKARDVGRRYQSRWVVAADTIVALGTEILGKPHNPEVALKILKKLNNTTHLVITGVCILNKGLNVEHRFASVSKVVFKNNSLEILENYAKSREPLDKAGAYAIQGKGAALIDHFEGDLDNIIGFPLKQWIHEYNMLRMKS